MAVSTEERALIAQAVKKDRQAFARLYVLYYDGVLRRVLAIVRDKEEAQDITSEAFLRAWNSIEKFQDRDVPIVAWFGTIAERLAFRQLKKRRPSVSLENIVLEADADRSPENLSERNADAMALRIALLQLPDLQREVLSRRFLDEMSYDEVGTALGKPTGTVRVLQFRALRALRSIVSDMRKQRAASPLPGAISK